MSGDNMSEQMTSRDIEDVLSSIRRLVSEDLRPAPRGPAATGGESGKLLLTPAHRVVPAAAGARNEADAAPAAPQEPRVDLVLAALGRALQPEQGGWEPETGDPSPLRLEDPIMTPALAEVPGLARARDGRAVSAPGGPAPRAPTARSSQPASPPEIRVTDPNRETVAAPPGAEAPRETAAVAPDLPPAAPPAGASLADILPPAAEAVIEGEGAPAWAQLDPEEPAVAAPEPETPREAVRDPAWSAAAEAAARAELEANARASQGAFAAEDLDETDDMPSLDEETLRQIIREVLREELSGPLGERITRNIRKLVHQEIARALSLRDIG